MFFAVSSAFARCVIITSGNAEPWIFERLPPLLALALAAALASLLLRRWQLVLALRRLDKDALDPNDALRIDAVRHRIAIAEIKGGGRCRCSLAQQRVMATLNQLEVVSED